MLFSQRRAFPRDSFFSRLLDVASYSNGKVIVNDKERGIQASYGKLFQDAAQLQQKIRESLVRDILDQCGIINHDHFYVGVLAPTGYEFIVASLSVLALGAVLMPIPTGAPVEEISYMVQQCSAACILVSSEQGKLATQVAERVATTVIPIINTASAPDNDPLPVGFYELEPAPSLSENRPAILFFTSGTTGASKGVLHARRFLNALAQAARSESECTCLLFMSVFWASPFSCLFSCLLKGIRLEIQDLENRHDLIWERLRQCDITHLQLPPETWYNLMRFFQQRISKLPVESAKEYIRGAQYIRYPSVAGGMPSNLVKDFWRNLRGGQPIRVRYGSTEAGLITEADLEASSSAESNIGAPIQSVVTKLSNEDEGELLVKSPTLFLRYLNSPRPSTDCFDTEGFFRTGDLVYRQGKNYIFRGRANSDFFKFFSDKVPRLAVESCLVSLPYIEEGYIMPVPDLECTYRVAALVRFRHGYDRVNLHTLREHMSAYLPIYQLPTLLRVLEEQNAVPRALSTKISLKKAVAQYFRQDEERNCIDDEVEVLDLVHSMEMETPKAWALSSLQEVALNV